MCPDSGIEKKEQISQGCHIWRDCLLCLPCWHCLIGLRQVVYKATLSYFPFLSFLSTLNFLVNQLHSMNVSSFTTIRLRNIGRILDRSMRFGLLGVSVAA